MLTRLLVQLLGFPRYLRHRRRWRQMVGLPVGEDMTDLNRLLQDLRGDKPCPPSVE